MRRYNTVQNKTVSMFPLVDGIVDERLHRVHPVMQNEVLLILRVAAGFPVSLVLFGSSITQMCDSRSDIDLAVITRKGKEETFIELVHAVKRAVRTPVDFIHVNELKPESVLLEEICRTGYVIQEDKHE